MTLPNLQDPGVKPTDPPAEPPKADDPLSALSPEARKVFEQVNANLLTALEKEREAHREAQKRASVLEKTAQESEKNRLKDKEDYKKLYEEAEKELATYKPKAEKLETYETIMKDNLAAQLAEIPEERRSLVPSWASVEDQLKYIAQNRALLSKSTAFDIGAGKLGGGNNKKTVELTDDQRIFARNTGVTDEEYAKNLKK
jgi:hypothetical protein